MDPVPYTIQEEDVDEVLSAYEPVGGGEWTEDARREVRQHVMRNVIDLGEIVRTAPETERPVTDVTLRVQALGNDTNPDLPLRRDVALAAIEDLLIRDGILDITDREMRVFPVVMQRDDERDDL